MSPNAKKALIAGVALVVLFFLVTQPLQSADAVQTFLGYLRDGAEAIMTFVRALFQ